mmetsp:Transcript_1902/g.4120  ORF Transcript_1902/g.4120 Transcript_1902/m.4120 type:complete len:161 (+) Transcript_1902:202-684(+)
MRCIPNGRISLSVVTVLLMVHLQEGCSAFSSGMNSIPGFYSKSGANPILRPVKSNVRLNVASSLPPEHGSYSLTQDVELEMKGALEIARDMTRIHGLCAEPSRNAWAAVDEIYLKIQVLRDGGEHASIIRPQSPRPRRKVMFSSRITPSKREIKGRRYFF